MRANYGYESRFERGPANRLEDAVLTRSIRSRFTPHVGLVEFGRFSLRRRLGRGGSGTVYEALDPHVGSKAVALKVMRRRAPRGLSEIERWATRTVLPPGIVQPYDEGRIDGFAFLAMKKVDSVKLFPSRPARLPHLHEHIAYRIATSLFALHRLGVVHGDVKPANIAVTRSGEPFLLDLGSASWIDAAEVVSWSRGFSSRRQVVGEARDWYGLGQTIAQLLEYGGVDSRSAEALRGVSLELTQPRALDVEKVLGTLKQLDKECREQRRVRSERRPR